MDLNKSYLQGQIQCSLENENWPLGYKKIMLNSTEHEIYPAYKIRKLKNNDVSCFKTLRYCIYPIYKG